MQKVHRYFVDNAEIYGINSWIDWINQRNRESTESILSLDWLYWMRSNQSKLTNPLSYTTMLTICRSIQFKTSI